MIEIFGEIESLNKSLKCVLNENHFEESFFFFTLVLCFFFLPLSNILVRRN